MERNKIMSSYVHIITNYKIIVNYVGFFDESKLLTV